MKFRIKKTEEITFSTPQEMYDDYKNRRIDGIHDYQSKMIDSYISDAINKKDVSLELPTGTGKTLVGLLIAEFRRRKYKEKVLYLCPTNQLVHQTVEQAKSKYGIDVVGFTGSIKNYDPSSKSRYDMGKSVAISNYSSLFNTNTYFKDADIIILDDAHSSEGYIASNWTLNINRFDNNELYYELADIFKNEIDEISYNRMLTEEPTSEDQVWVDKIPYIRLIEKNSRMQKIIDQKVVNTNLRYSWSNIRDYLHACNIFISWREIIIRPIIPPTQTLDAFTDAKQRIYMSATFGKSGELERITGTYNIHQLPMVKDWENKTIGRKYFMFPNASFKQNDLREVIKKSLFHAGRALMLVKDDYTREAIAKYIGENSDATIYTARDIERDKSQFANDENGFLVLANRFDGMDFANDECRLLILFDLPSATHLQEKFLITRMASKTLFNERINTRLTQALGRCTRNATDYAAVCVIGDELMNNLCSPQKITKFNPELRAEIEFGKENSIEQSSVDDYLELLQIFLDKHNNDTWNEAENAIISDRNGFIKANLDDYDNNKTMLELKKIAPYEIKMQYSLWKKDYITAIKHIDSILHNITSNELKGYKGFWNYIAGSLCFALNAEGNRLYLSKGKEYLKDSAKSSISITWLSNLVTDEDSTVDDNLMTYNIERLENTFISYSKYTQGKFEEFTGKILEKLSSSDGVAFEKGHQKLGEILGYNSINPTGDASPDPYWVINNDYCIVSEDKIYKSDTSSIPAKHIRQAMSHEDWIKENEVINKNGKILTVFITNASSRGEGTDHLGKNVFYLGKDEFLKFAVNAVNCVSELRRTFVEEGDPTWREHAINKMLEYSCSPSDYVNLFYKTKLSDLY